MHVASNLTSATIVPFGMHNIFMRFVGSGYESGKIEGPFDSNIPAIKGEYDSDGIIGSSLKKHVARFFMINPLAYPALIQQPHCDSRI